MPRITTSADAAPIYGLYGESLRSSPVYMHVEPIQTRSSVYDGRFDLHSHPNLHQITWVSVGTLSEYVDGETFELSADNAAVIPATVPHSSVANKSTMGYVLTVSLNFCYCPDSKVATTALEDLLSTSCVISVANRSEEDARSITSIFEVLNREFAAGHEASNLVTTRLAQSACLLLARHKQSTGGNAQRDPHLKTFLSLVDRYFASDMQLHDYAARCEVSSEKLIKITNKFLGKSPMQAVQDRRLKESCQRLIHTDDSVSATARACGFVDVAYFARFFRKRIGCTATEYRKKFRGTR
ncbi:helix-turn-helix domain-containing protein [Burkholderia multivorans]|uniref:helix-turn-helix domain-containing protein n=1 Tax=Burkholderia multivorans TaxID=87883 RepID=UPI001B9C8C96|nr:helix-turn-helix domain-containing protein [Burkholderia multivorans]MBR8044158.1 helix-turn-helix domain-containing protein [Burkholderia multivorans]